MTHDIIMAAAGQAGGPSDANFENTVLLLHGDGTNGAQNNTFLDSSTNNFTITRNGNTTQGTFTPFSKQEGAWGNFFDGSGDYLSNTSVALITQSVSTFTAEGWIYMTAAPTSDANNISGLMTLDGQPAGAGNYLSFGPISNRILYLRWYDGAGKTAIGSTTLNLNQWYHIACVVNSNAIQFYVNGVAETMTGTTTLTNRNGSNAQFGFGVNAYGAFSGYLSNARVTTTAVYTSNFTPSGPLTNISNTKVLTCQSNRFIDNSSNAYALTANGDVRVTPFSPFPTTVAYSPSVTGGSGYFDGTGDYLTAATNNAFAFGTGAFTLEAWIYVTGGAGTWRTIFAENTGVSDRFQFAVNNSNKLSFSVNNSLFFASTSNVVLNTWHHVAVVSTGSTAVSGTISLFLNGVREGTTTYVSSIPTTSATLHIGAFPTPTEYMLGYMSSMRIVKGSAVYDPTQSTLTVPTAPLTAISGTSLLLSGTNAGILDNTMSNNLETIGNAQIDTAVKEYGTGSMEFDGNGDACVGRPFPDFNFGTGDFTVECWIYIAVTPTAQTWLMSFGPNGSGAVSRGWGVRLHDGTTAGLSFVYQNSGNVANNFGSLPSATTWAHIAFCRSGAVMRCFVNGAQLGSTWTLPYSSIDNTSATDYYGIGGFDNSNNGYPGRYWYNGLIDDLRITKGIARYTSNFTAPIARLPNQ